MVIATTSGHLDATVTVRPGYGRPALEANSGLLILAFQPMPRRQALMRDASPLSGNSSAHKSFSARSTKYWRRDTGRAQPRYHGGDRHRLPDHRARRLRRSGDFGSVIAAAPFSLKRESHLSCT